MGGGRRSLRQVMDGCSECAKWGKGLKAESLLGCVFVCVASVFSTRVIIIGGSRHPACCWRNARFHKDKIKHVTQSFKPSSFFTVVLLIFYLRFRFFLAPLSFMSIFQKCDPTDFHLRLKQFYREAFSNSA